MIGEIRDRETAEIAIQSALTGHMVFSTLHTNDSAGALTRLVEMGVEPFLAASSIVGILAQRLVRRVCPPLPEGKRSFGSSWCGNWKTKACIRTRPFFIMARAVGSA